MITIRIKRVTFREYINRETCLRISIGTTHFCSKPDKIHINKIYFLSCIKLDKHNSLHTINAELMVN